MKFYAKISFTMDKNHPNVQYVKDWTEHKMFNFDDIYRFDNVFSEDYCVDRIKENLKLLAGGGYNWDHIHNITFEIKKMWK